MSTYTQSKVDSQSASNKTAWRPVAAALIGIACMIAAAIWLHPSSRMDNLGPAAIVLVAGLIALGMAARGINLHIWPLAANQHVGERYRRLARDWRPLAAGIILLALVAENNAMRFAPPSFDFMHYHVQFVLFALGIALLVYSQADAPRGQRMAAAEWLLIVLIFVAALIPRLVQLDTLVRTLVDELPWVDGVRALWWRHDYELLRPMSSTFPFSSIFPYWEAGAVEIFGTNLIGLRITSSLIGALTVVALYALARQLVDRPTALIAALILAFFPPHVHFSRLALLNMVDPLPGTMALAYAARGLRYNRRFDWALAGAALGMTHYFFEAGRLLFTPLMIAWIGWLFITRRDRLRAWWGGIAVMALIALLVAAPFYYVLASNGGLLAGRLDQSRFDTTFVLDVLAGNRPPEDLIRHVLTPLLILVNRPENAAYYGGDNPLVLSGVVPLLLLGTAFVLLRPRRPAFVLIIWILAAAAGNVLMKDPAVSARYVVALPALALLIALGLRETAQVLTTLVRIPAAQTALRWAVVAALPILAVMHMAYYFGPHIERFNEQNRASKIYRDGVDAVLRAAALPTETFVILISQPEHDSNVPGHFLNFMRRDMLLASITPQEVMHTYLADLSIGRPYAFFVAADDDHSLNLLRYYFDLQPPQITPFHDDVPPDRQYVLYFAPLGSARPVLRDKNAPIQIITPPAAE